MLSRLQAAREAMDRLVLDPPPPSGYAGDSGSIRAIAPGSRTSCGTLDSSEIEVQADGIFEMLFGHERSAWYIVNFIATPTRTQLDGTDRTRQYVSSGLWLSEIVYDRESERQHRYCQYRGRNEQ